MENYSKPEERRPIKVIFYFYINYLGCEFNKYGWEIKFNKERV
ncbi:MAG: hypothetical protein ACK52J_04220 [bacterium]